MSRRGGGAAPPRRPRPPGATICGARIDERRQLESAILAQERLRGTLPDEVIDTTLSALRARLEALSSAPRTERRRKQVTVLFADVSGFTALAEQRDAEEVSDAVNALWRALDAVITSHGGRVDKHIGDAVMGIWGADVARENHAESAVRAALAMQEVVARLREGDEVIFPALRLRIGINSGPVVLGSVGTTGEHTALGDTVNVAARLEAAAPVGGVLIGHDTYRHVRGIFAVTPLEPLRVKGKREPLRSYLVTAALPRAFRTPTRGVEGVETPRVGRGAELDALFETCRTTRVAGRLGAALVLGPAGIGKSRLLFELEERLHLEPAPMRLLRARADPQREEVPYALLADLMTQAFDLPEGESSAQARARLEAGFARWCGAQGECAAHLVGHLAGLSTDPSPHVDAVAEDPQQLRDRAFRAVTELVQAFAAERPLALLLEDLHWADHGSLDLLATLVASCRDHPVALVLLARPQLLERRPAWREPPMTLLELRPLSDEEIRALVRSILDRVVEVPEALMERILAAAEGNPFYVEELVKSLLEEEVIVREEPAWRVALERLGELSVPPTLTALLQARLDRLPEAERVTLQRAAVVGRVFWDEACAAMAPPSERPGVLATLAALEARGLVAEERASVFAGCREYRFEHALLHEVAYEGVLRRLRGPCHLAVARWLLERDERDAQAPLLARHFDRGEAPAEAAHHYRKAGDEARRRYANEEAAAFLERALQTGGLDDGARATVADQLGDLLLLLTRYDEAIVAFRVSEEAAAATGDAVAQGRALTGISLALGRRGSAQEALEVAEEATRRLRAAPEVNLSELADALRVTSWQLSKLGDPRQAMERAEAALAAALEGGEPRCLTRVLIQLSWVEGALGRHVDAERHLAQALQIARARGDRRAEAAALMNLGEIARFTGDFPRAVELDRAALHIVQELGDRDQEALARNNLGGALLGEGAAEAAIVELRAALLVSESARGDENLAETHRFLAEASLAVGDVEGARRLVQRSLELARRSRNLDHEGHACRVLGMILDRAPDSAPAESPLGDADACFSRSARCFEEAGMPAEHAGALAAWAASRLARGDREEGGRLWRTARDLLLQLGLERLVARLGTEPAER